MASRKMTFTIPGEMIRSCESANNNADVLAIERDWGALVDDTDWIVEPWNNAPQAAK